MGVFATSGEWVLKPGHEEAFFAAWLKTKDTDPPLQGVITPPRLLRDLNTPGRFVSFAEFASLEVIQEFRSQPDFRALVEAMRAHLDVMNIPNVRAGDRAMTRSAVPV